MHSSICFTWYPMGAWWFFNNDLNASQTQGPQTSGLSHGSIQTPRVEALLPNHQPESLQDMKSGDRGKEKIVYL